MEKYMNPGKKKVFGELLTAKQFPSQTKRDSSPIKTFMTISSSVKICPSSIKSWTKIKEGAERFLIIEMADIEIKMQFWDEEELEKLIYDLQHI